MGSAVSSSPKTVSLKQEVALPAVQGVSSPEVMCGKDERFQVDPMTSPPYKWICYLTVYSGTKVAGYATGFKIHIPEVGRTAIVTSGHVTYVNGALATKITVTFPGQAPIDVGTSDLYAAPEFIASGNEDYDYGLIILPGAGNSDDGFGWSAIVPDGELNNRVITICGYPVDKPKGTMWITGGKITDYSATWISYMIDTGGGESGSPVFTWYGGYWTILGVHQGATLRSGSTDGVCPNYAVPFTAQMIRRFLCFMKELKITSLRSASTAFSDVYIRCDGQQVKNYNPDGVGTVNCQYKPPGDWEKFYIYPVEMPPSLAPESGSYKVVIQSKAFNNVFIRLNGQKMSQHESSGGGQVNCQSGAGPWEIYYKEQVSEVPLIVAFRSVAFPHCYIRLEGWGVNSFLSSGGGTVNCQWYNDPSSSPPTKEAWESFCVEETVEPVCTSL